MSNMSSLVIDVDKGLCANGLIFGEVRYGGHGLVEPPQFLAETSRTTTLRPATPPTDDLEDSSIHRDNGRPQCEVRGDGV
jgi:hypothetical protein